MPAQSGVSSYDPYWNPSRQWRYSYSGADARVWAFYDAAPEIITQLESIHTISISIHEAKGQARALGYRGVRGLARGVRTIAGSIIFTVIEDNPLRPLMENLLELQGRPGFKDPGWSIDRDLVGVGSSIDGTLFNNRMAALLPPTNLLGQYVSEVGPRAEKTTFNPFIRPDGTVDDTLGRGVTQRASGWKIDGAAWLLRGVEFLDEGMVTSVNDIVTEVTVSFIACDFKPLASQVFENNQKIYGFADMSPDNKKSSELEERIKGKGRNKKRDYKKKKRESGPDSIGDVFGNTPRSL